MVSSVIFRLMNYFIIIIFICLIVIVGLVSGGQYLYFWGDYKMFFCEDNLYCVVFEEMQDIFNKIEFVNLLVVFELGNVFNVDILNFIQVLIECVW